LTRPGIEPTIYHTLGKHANHYTTDEPTIYHTLGKHANHYTTDAVTMDIEFEYSQFCHPGIRSERKTNKYERHLKNIFTDVHVGMIEEGNVLFIQ
jgi:hypothetical protein